MLNKRHIDDLVQQVRAFLPEDLRQTREDLEKNITVALNATLTRMNLVTREEYEIQRELLLRTRTLLEDLEGRIRELENRLGIETKE